MIIALLERIRGNKHLKQTSALFVWNIIGSPINLAINFFMTRYLGAEAFGDYSFVGRVFNFVFILMNFGLYRSVGRAILLSNDELKNREYYGMGLLLWLFTVVMTIIGLLFYGLFSTNIEEKGIRMLFIMVIPFCSVTFLNNFNEQVLPSSNKISLLITQRYGPRILLLVLIMTLFYIWGSCSNKLLICLCSLFGTQVVFSSYVVLKLRPLFSNRIDRF
jgi:O-antigen/teichoic acid export membrane protein